LDGRRKPLSKIVIGVNSANLKLPNYGKPV
jgi:hypothetical protein